MGVPISYLRDNFTDGIQAAAWGASGTTGVATKAETGGQAVFSLPSSALSPPHEASYQTGAAYDLTGDSFAITIGTMVATGVAATAYFRLIRDSANNYEWTQTSGTLKARKTVAGVTTNLYSVSWNASTYKYLRIREASGTVYFDSSSNGSSWTNRGSTTIASAFAVTDLVVRLGASCGTVASPGSFKLDEVNLASVATTWHWTEIEWPNVYRFSPITIAATSGQGYVATGDSVDAGGALVNPRYFSGPIGSTSGGYLALTEVATQAAAQAMAADLPTDGRWDLPVPVDGRVVRLYHRSTTGSSYTLREYYPRRQVESDDIRAEDIRTIHLGAQIITADKLYVALTMTGKRIQTAEAGARVVLSGETNGGLIGYGATDTYDAVAGTGTYQLRWSKVDGKLYMGGGNAVGDASGLWLRIPNDFSLTTPAVTWRDGSANVHGKIVTYYEDATHPGSMLVLCDGTMEIASRVAMDTGPTSGDAVIHLNTSRSASPGTIDVQGTLTTDNSITAGGAITAALADSATNATSVGLTINHDTSGTPAAGFGTDVAFNLESTTTADRSAALIRVVWATATDASRKSRMRFFVFDTAARDALTLEASGSAPMIGFLGAAPVARPTVSGSRGSNAALTSLLTALANLGLVTDSSS